MRFDCAKALKLFRAGLKQESDAEAHYFVGNCERWRGDYEAARLAYGQAETAPRSVEIRGILASAKESLEMAFDSTKMTDYFKSKSQECGHRTSWRAFHHDRSSYGPHQSGWCDQHFFG